MPHIRRIDSMSKTKRRSVAEVWTSMETRAKEAHWSHRVAGRVMRSIGRQRSKKGKVSSSHSNHRLNLQRVCGSDRLTCMPASALTLTCLEVILCAVKGVLVNWKINCLIGHDVMSKRSGRTSPWIPVGKNVIRANIRTINNRAVSVCKC